MPTSSTAHLHFMCTASHVPDRDLAALGIVIERPHGVIAHRIIRGQLVAEIGKLIVIEEVIHVVPKDGITPKQLGHLTGAAEVAWMTERSANLGWQPSVVGGVPRWTTWISVPADKIAVTALGAMSARLSRPGMMTA